MSDVSGYPDTEDVTAESPSAQANPYPIAGPKSEGKNPYPIAEPTSEAKNPYPIIEDTPPRNAEKPQFDTPELHAAPNTSSEEPNWLERSWGKISGTAQELSTATQARYSEAQKAFESRQTKDALAPMGSGLIAATAAMLRPSPYEQRQDQRAMETSLGPEFTQRINEQKQRERETGTASGEEQLFGSDKAPWALPLWAPGQKVGPNNPLAMPITKDDDDVEVPLGVGSVKLSSIKAVYQPFARFWNTVSAPGSLATFGLGGEVAAAKAVPEMADLILASKASAISDAVAGARAIRTAKLATATEAAAATKAPELAMTGVFSAGMTSGAIQQLAALPDVISDPDKTTAQKFAASADAAVSVGMASLAVNHLSKEVRSIAENPYTSNEGKIDEIAKATGKPHDEVLLDVGEAAKKKFEELRLGLPANHIAVKIERPDGSTYDAVMSGYWDTSLPGEGPKLTPNIGRHTEAGVSHGMLAEGERIIGGNPPPELWEITPYGPKLKEAPPEAPKGGAMVTVMGDHVQVEIPGKGERPAFSGTPEQAREAGFDVPTEDLPEGQHKVSFEPAPNPEVIGIANKWVDARRKELGLDPLPKPETKADERLWSKAVESTLKDPELPAHTVDNFRDSDEAPTDKDYALMEYRAVELENANADARQRINKAIDAGKIPDPADTQRMEETEAQLVDLHDVLRQTGTASGRGLRARQLLANRDFSLAKMISERQAVRGEKLTPEQKAETEVLATRIKEAKEALDRVTKERDSLLAERASKEAHESLTKDVAEDSKAEESATPEEKKTKTPTKLREFISQQAEAARQRIRERTTQAPALIDPTWVADLAIIGVEHLTKAGENIAEFTKRMIEDVGEWVKPHIEQIFGEAKKVRDTMAKDFTPKDVVDSISRKLASGGDVTPEFRRLAREAIELGMTDRDRVIDFVHDQVRESAPEMTRRGVQDAISGYGKYRELSKDGITQKLADVSAQLRLVSKLEDLLAGKEPEKTGAERRESSAEETLLRKKISEFEQKAKMDTAVASALNREKQVIEAHISELEKKIAEGDISTPSKKVDRPASPEIEVLKQRRDLLNRKLAEMRKEATPKADPQQTQLKALKTRLEKSTEEYERRIAEKDYTSKAKRQPLTDPEVDAARAKNERAKQEYQQALIQDRFSKYGALGKATEFYTRWYRAFILSNPMVYAKLLGAGLWRSVTTPVEEMTGGVLSQLPGVREVAKKATYEGGYKLSDEIAAVKGIILGVKEDFMSSLKTGKSDISTLYGKGRVAPEVNSLANYVGYSHAAMKAPVKRMAYERYVEKGLRWAAENGMDIHDPAVQQQIRIGAYKKAQSAIFMHDNWLTDRINQFLALKTDKATGKVLPGSAVLHVTGKTILPVVRVPTNIVAETFEYAVGLETGSIRLANALRKGADKLEPEQADLIMRELKKGLVGNAVLLLGYFGAHALGGLRDDEVKKKPTDVPAGKIRLFETDIDRLWLHHPFVETLQFAATVNYILNQQHPMPRTATGMMSALRHPQGQLGDAIISSLFDLGEEVPLARGITTTAKVFNPKTRQAALGDLAQSVAIPQVLSFIARATDKDLKGEPIKRKATTIEEHLKEGVPGLRETLPVKR